MEARYRTDYAGEFVILESKWSAGKKDEIREWIPNPIENHHLSGRAACIGSDIDHPTVGDGRTFDYTRLQKHRGGLLGSKKLQTYGTGKIAQQMRLDFAVETQVDNLNKILETGYQRDNIVYTTARNCINYPGEFYLIPYKPRMIDLALTVYLAAFDGHQEIFLLGYSDQTDVNALNWTSHIAQIFLAYPGVKFYLIGENTHMPDEWLNCFNVKSMNYREFINYCDV
jgi:hypothetical protein